MASRSDIFRGAMQAWIRLLAGYRPTLSDYRGHELVERFLRLVDRHRPLHVSIVGGEPLVRYRELETSLAASSRVGSAVARFRSPDLRSPC